MVVDVHQHVEPDLPSKDLKVRSHQRCLLEGVKLAVPIGNVVQAPKVENLAKDEGASGDDDLAGEADATFWAAPPASAIRWVAPTTIES